MTGAQILGVAGTLASLLSMSGGWLLTRRPKLGARLLSLAGGVMLAANVLVALRG